MTAYSQYSTSDSAGGRFPAANTSVYCAATCAAMQALERRAAQADRSMRAQAERVAQLEAAHTADAALLEEVAEAEAALRDAAKVGLHGCRAAPPPPRKFRFGAAVLVCACSTRSCTTASSRSACSRSRIRSRRRLKPHSALRCADTPLPIHASLRCRCGVGDVGVGRWGVAATSTVSGAHLRLPCARGNIATVLRRWLQCAVAGRARNATVYGTKHTMSCGIPALGRHQLRAVWGT